MLLTTKMHTNISAALEVNSPGFTVDELPFVVPCLGDIDLILAAVESLSVLSRKGFLDVGLSGAVEGRLKPAFIGDGKLLAGETARFRKGLLDERFVADGGEGCRLRSITY